MKKIISLFILLSLILVVSGCSTTGNTIKDVDAKEITVYKSPTCGCCVGYISELKKQGFEVNTITTENMNSIKDKYNIPREMQSCHTSITEGYFVEGHVPIEAVNKLLTEKPEIDGIALPDMPAGSPGMPGQKTGTWEIYKLTGGVYSTYIKI